MLWWDMLILSRPLAFELCICVDWLIILPTLHFRFDLPTFFFDDFGMSRHKGNYSFFRLCKCSVFYEHYFWLSFLFWLAKSTVDPFFYFLLFFNKFLSSNHFSFFSWQFFLLFVCSIFMLKFYLSCYLPLKSSICMFYSFGMFWYIT